MECERLRIFNQKIFDKVHNSINLFEKSAVNVVKGIKMKLHKSVKEYEDDIGKVEEFFDSYDYKSY